MAVLKRFRTVAKLEFFTNAEKLRQELFFLMARDFGVKNQIRTVEILTANMAPQDAAAFAQIAQRYQMTRFNCEYPEWIVSKCRDSVWDISRNILLYLTQANSIYPTCLTEARERRIWQDRAIGCCEQLMKELQFILTVFPIEANKYLPYVALIEKEITLVKAWRKSDNQRYKALPA